MRAGLTKGFLNVITWADSAAAASRKFTDYIAEFNRHLIAIENVCEIHDGDVHLNEEFADMVERARANRDAIILGTLHGYKEN